MEDKIDWKATDEWRQEEWNKFISKEPYKSSYEMMLALKKDVAELRAKEQIAHEQGKPHKMYQDMAKDPQKTIDYIAKQLANAFSLQHSPVLVFKP